MFRKLISRINGNSEPVNSVTLNALFEGCGMSDLSEMNSTNFRNLVTQAYYLSSLDQGEDHPGYSGTRLTRLASIFTRVWLKKKPNDISFHRLAELGPETVFPDDSTRFDRESTNKHWKGLISELTRVIRLYFNSDFDIFISHLDAALKRYAWCVPGKPCEDIPDISLYDLSRTTAAIAACLYDYHKEKDEWEASKIKDNSEHKFRLVVGDLSGIQSYIFDISHQGAGGIAKRLRARSFYLTVLSEIASHIVLEEFDLPLTNLLMASGGKFYILIPNTIGSEQRIANIQIKLDEALADKFQGEVCINLAQVKFSGGDFRNFGNVLANLAQRLAERKSKPLSSLLCRDGLWAEKAFVFEPGSKHELGLCAACRKRFAVREQDGAALCIDCIEQTKMGKQLVNASHIAFYREPDKGDFEVLDGYSFKLLPESFDDLGKPYLVTAMNGVDVIDMNIPVSGKFIANYVPVAEDDASEEDPKTIAFTNTPLSFDVLAKRANGRPYLGYLKADVDHLGQLFVFGLKDEKKNWDTISRIITLSRMMETFFAGWVNHVLKTSFRSCYTVFSGGDDLLIIGPWDEILDFGIELNSALKRFTGNNPDLTLSMAVTLAQPKSPISSVCRQAEDLLREAKDTILPGESAGRNQVSSMGATFKTGNLKSFIHDGKQLAKWVASKDVSVGFVRRLRDYSLMFERYYKDNEPGGLKFVSLLHYDTARNIRPNQAKQRNWIKGLFNLESDKLKGLKFISTYALLTTGGE